MPTRELQPPGATNGLGHERTLKKHKQLPHPRRNGSGDYSHRASSLTNSNPQSSTTNSGATSRGLSLETDVASPSSINASPRTLKHASRRIIGSVDLPPTPPAHSRNSSNDASPPVAPATNGDIVESPTCSTPVNVQSPPTPDFTPPRPRRVQGLKGLAAGLGKGLEGEKRREMGSRNDSMNTTTSFVTAREELDFENDSSTIRGDGERTVDGMDHVPDYDGSNDREPPPKMRPLGLGSLGLEDPLTGHRTPTNGTPLRKKFSFEHDFDGDFSPESEARGKKEVGNPILSRNVTITRGKSRRKPYILDNDTPTKQSGEHIRQHSQTHGPHERQEVVEDRVLGTSNAIRHLRQRGISEGESNFVRPTPRHSRQEEDMSRGHKRSRTQPERLSPLPKAPKIDMHQSSQDPSQDARKFSNGSHRSNSTVEAVVMIQPQQPKMRRTLRHKERMGSLRNFSLSAAEGTNGDMRGPLPSLRHKSVDLPMRNMEDCRIEERPRRTEQLRMEERQRTDSERPLPENSGLFEGPEAAPARSRQVSEATIVPARSRQVSEQTVIEHPSRSPLPELPRDEVLLIAPLVEAEPPGPAVQISQAQSQPISRPPQATETQAEMPKRRYSIERKPVPIRDPRPRIDSTATTDTVKTMDSSDTSKSRSRKALLADGIIPVVIVPARASSLKEQSRPPSLRSTSASRQQSKQGSRASSTAPLSASAGTNIPGAWPSWTETPLSIGKRRNSDGCSLVSGKATTPKEDGLVRSIDFGPPAIPVRRSSMSAPTTPMGSRNVSRSNSLTADSLRRHNEDQALAALSSHAEKQRSNGLGEETRTVSQTIQQRRDENRDSGVGYGVGIGAIGHSVRIEEPDISELDREHRHRSTHFSVDTNGDPLFGQRLSAQVTPFSARSDVTGASHGTALEVAEAREVGVFKHQNTSVQLVDQDPPASSASESTRLRQEGAARSTGGRATTSSSTGTTIRPRLQQGERYSSASLASPTGFNVPGSTNAKFAQPQASINIVPSSPPQSSGTYGSPLINPRQPPQVPAGPPAFKIIPPTPADLLAQEEASKQLGWEPPLDSRGEVSRPPRRNWSVKLSGLARSLSVGRRKSERDRPKVDDVDVGPSLSPPMDEERPKEEGKLHPFWRPANYREEDDDCDCEECREYWDRVEEEARTSKRNGDSSSNDNSKLQRPGMPRRTTSQMSQIGKKMKRTFAILPLAGVETTRGKGDDGYNVSYATARRTIKRSGSGNLKVVKRVGNVSKESLKLQEYLNMSSRRQRSFRRRLREGKSKEAISSQDPPQTPPAQIEPQRKRFSWVGGSTDSPASKYPSAFRYPPPSSSGTYDAGPLKRTFSLPTRRTREATDSTSFPPRVQVQWLGLGGLGGLTRRFSGKGRADGSGSPEERREGLKRTISSPRGVKDGVDDVLTRRQMEEAERNRGRMKEGVHSEDFASYGSKDGWGNGRSQEGYR